MKFSKIFFIVLFWVCDQQILTGLDNLIINNFNILQGKNIGLVINHTSLDRYGNHIVDLLSRESNIKVLKIFSPEHGYSGSYSAGEIVHDEIEPLTGAKIVSLYGINKDIPSNEVEGLDALVYDIQDIGSRYYTYISSMASMMDVAATNDIPFIILDRPNPLGRRISGPILDIEYTSFVGMFPIPIRHGMTTGEVGKMINAEYWLKSKKKVDLSIINITGWDMQPGYFTIPPSPNIQDYLTALVYNGMCLLEGTNISEGRGTDFPFLYFGAPWIDEDILTNQLNLLELEGVMFEAKVFTPIASGKSKWPKYENEKCGGSKIIITDRIDFDPIITAVEIIYTIAQLYPDKFKFFETNFIDKLYGSNKLRLSIESKGNLSGLYGNWDSQFSLAREKYLLY